MTLPQVRLAPPSMIKMSHATGTAPTMRVYSARAMLPLLLLALQITVASAGDWTAFRGSQGTGIARHERPPIKWSNEEHVRWAIPLPGSGNGSPIVSAGRVFLTCATEHGRRRTLCCFDRETGRERWSQTVSVEHNELTHVSNPYCGTTPAADGELVVVWHGTGGLHAYSLSGEPRWHRGFGEIRHLWGYGTSPIISGDRVILFCGAGAEHFLAAVRLADGELLWRHDEPGALTNETPDGELTGSWCTPTTIHANGQELIVCALPTAVVAHSSETGAQVWRCEGLGSDRGKLVYASPLVSNNTVVVMSGYQGPVLAVRADGKGNVTETHVVWTRQRRRPQQIGSGVIIKDAIYVGNADGGTIQCLDLRTGQERYRERVRGGPHWASTVFANGLLYATNQSGTTRVFRPNANRFELVAVNHLGAVTNATPAISNNEIFIRTADNLYCIAED